MAYTAPIILIRGQAMANPLLPFARPAAAFALLGATTLLVSPAGSEPCAVLVEAPSLEVVSSRCVEDECRADNLLGYAHAGETYIAIAKYEKWLKSRAPIVAAQYLNTSGIIGAAMYAADVRRAERGQRG